MVEEIKIDIICPHCEDERQGCEKDRDNPEEAELRKLARIATKKWSHYSFSRMAEEIMGLYGLGHTIEEIEQGIRISRNLTGFRETLST